MIIFNIDHGIHGLTAKLFSIHRLRRLLGFSSLLGAQASRLSISPLGAPHADAAYNHLLTSPPGSAGSLPASLRLANYLKPLTFNLEPSSPFAPLRLCVRQCFIFGGQK